MKMIVINVDRDGGLTVPDSTIDAMAEHLRDMLPPGINPRTLMQDQETVQADSAIATPTVTATQEARS